MGNDETGTSSKSEKTPSPAQEQTSVHAYPDWAAIQAYYGPGVGLPPPYFNTAVSAGHAPHPFMWGPQPMMPPYGSPYAAIYPHGGVYAHPSIPVGSHAHGISTTSSATTCEPVTATTLSIETPSKPSCNKDQGPVKKRRCDGLAVSIGNGNSDNATNSTEHGTSESENSGREGSSDGSDRSTKIQGSHAQKKSREQTPGTGKPTGGAPLSGLTAGMDLAGSVAGKSKLSSAPVLPAMVTVMPPHDGVSSEHWVQDERELKREKRKQSNRESARRSRLRKQAETEELAAKVEYLTQENASLRSEMSRLTEKSEKLRKENSALMEKLKKAENDQAGADSDNGEAQDVPPPVDIENLLSRVNNSSSISRSMKQEQQREGERRENSNSNAKLHQLLESKSRTDAVAAS